MSSPKSDKSALIRHFSGHRPVINIILDGYGIGKGDDSDAIASARTPVMDRLKATYANSQLMTHGPFVGLPALDNLGGSEVGHLTLGAGKLLDQGSTLIFKSIEDRSFFSFPALTQGLDQAARPTPAHPTPSLHLLGLLSDGNVHSHIKHFEAVIEEAARRGVARLYVHALLDGRDVAVQSADQYAKQLQDLFDQVILDHPGFDYRFASVGGREVITMDRDKNWKKVKRGWDCHVLGRSEFLLEDIFAGIDYFRAVHPGITDQDLPPFNLKGKDGKAVTINDGDAVLLLNFRGDRAIEIAQAFDLDSFSAFDRERFPKIYFAGMMVYDEDTGLPKNQIIGNPKVPEPFGKRMLDLGIKQFRLAETQKYAHVTFFFNGGYRNPLDPSLEDYFLIESDKIDNFAAAPKMKALELAAKAVELIGSKRYGYGLINFANTDMVGHTGDFEAAKIAAETVDLALGQVLAAVEKAGGLALVTADHGNADEMTVFNKKTGQKEMSTKHSLNPVPVVLFDPGYAGQYRLRPNAAGKENNLAMVAATNYLLLGLEPPADLEISLFDL